MRQEHDAARTSKLLLGTAVASSAGSGTMAAQPDVLGTIGNDRSGTGGTPAVVSVQAEDAGQNGQAAKRAFMKAGADRPATSTSRIEEPASP